MIPESDRPAIGKKNRCACGGQRSMELRRIMKYHAGRLPNVTLSIVKQLPDNLLTMG